MTKASVPKMGFVLALFLTLFDVVMNAAENKILGIRK